MRNRKLRFFENNWSTILLILIVFLPFLVLLINGKVIYWGTASLQFIPWTQFLYDSILEGIFPFWNPYNGFGVPFIANHQSAVFYPLNWLMFPFYFLGGIKGLAVGMTLLIPTHLSIAGLGMKSILKKINLSSFSQLIGAVVFAFSGYILTRLSFISMVSAFAWLPWIIYAILHLKAIDDRNSLKSILILAFLVALQLLSGHAQTSYYSILLGFGILFFYNFQSIQEQLKKLLSYFISLLSSLLLAAVQILPTFEFLQNSQRSSEIGYEVAVSSSLWPGRLLTILFGNFWGNPNYHRFLSGGSFWEENIYLGVFPILLFSILFWILIRKNRSHQITKYNKIFIFGMFGILIFAILFSFGKFSAIFPFLYKNIPTFDLFQAPSRFLIVYVFLMSILSGIGYDIWFYSKFNHKKTIIYLVIFGGLSIFSILIKIYYPDFPKMTSDSLLLGGLIGFSFGIITLVKDKLKTKVDWLHFLVLFVIVLDLFFHNFVWNNFQSIKVFSEINQSNEFDINSRVFVKQEFEDFLKFNLFFRPDRIQSIVDLTQFQPEFIPNTNLLNNRYKLINNFDPLQLNLFSEFWKWLKIQKNGDLEKIISLVGGGYIYEIDPASPNYLLEKEIEPRNLVQWYGCEIAVDSEIGLNQILYLEQEDSLNRCLIVEASHGNEVDKSESNHDANIQFYLTTSNKVDIEYQSINPGWLVIRQSWYPGWRAILDGRELLEIEKVDFLFQGVRVPSGSHSLEIIYFPNSIKLGILISSVSLIILVFLLYYSKNGKAT